MYEITPIDFSRLKANAYKDYRRMLDPQHLRFLKNNRGPFLLTLGISLDNQPVGVASGQIHIDLPMANSPKHAEIYHIHLEPQHQSKDLYAKILGEFEAFSQKAHCYGIFLFLEPNAILEQILMEQSWQGPKPHLAYYTFDAPTFHPPWFNQFLTIPWPKDFHPFRWKEIKKSEWEALKKQEKQGTIPDDVSPFYPYPAPIESINSLGLRHNGAVIGWILTHRTKDTIVYSSFFIQHDYQMQGLSLKLLAEAIKLQKDSNVSKARMEINLRKSPPNWIRFIRTHLEPYAKTIEKENFYYLDLKKT